jgi:O-antigen/teichoic acid export membrane protein
MSDTRTSEELTDASATGVRWITIARLITEVMLVVSMVVLARLLPPKAFGMFAVAVIVQELATNVPGEGVGTALVQRKEITRMHLEGGFALSLLTGLVLAAVTLVLCVVVIDPIFGADTAKLVALTTPNFILGAVLALPMTVLRRKLDFRRLSLLDLVLNVVRSLGAIFLAAVFGLDASALVLGGLAAMVTVVTMGLFFARPPLPRWHTQAVRDLMPYGGPASLACFAWAGFRNGDYAIVGAKLGTATAGVYWRGFQLAVEYQRKISTIMAQIAFPVLARTEDAEQMYVLRRRMVRLLTICVFPLLASLAILAPTVVPWIFGPDWESAVQPTQLLVGAGAATVVIDAVGSVLMAEGRARALLGYGVAHFAVYATVVLIVASHGLKAVGIAASAVHLTFLVIAYQLLVKTRSESALKMLWDDCGAAFTASLGLVAVAWPIQVALSNAHAGAFIHLVVVGAAGTLAFLLVLRLLFADEWGDVMALRRRVLPLERLRGVSRGTPVTDPV